VENQRKKTAKLTRIRQPTVPPSQNQETSLKNESVIRKSRKQQKIDEKNANLPEFAD